MRPHLLLCYDWLAVHLQRLMYDIWAAGEVLPCICCDGLNRCLVLGEVLQAGMCCLHLGRFYLYIVTMACSQLLAMAATLPMLRPVNALPLSMAIGILTSIPNSAHAVLAHAGSG